MERFPNRLRIASESAFFESLRRIGPRLPLFLPFRDGSHRATARCGGLDLEFCRAPSGPSRPGIWRLPAVSRSPPVPNRPGARQDSKLGRCCRRAKRGKTGGRFGLLSRSPPRPLSRLLPRPVSEGALRLDGSRRGACGGWRARSITNRHGADRRFSPGIFRCLRRCPHNRWRQDERQFRAEDRPGAAVRRYGVPLVALVARTLSQAVPAALLRPDDAAGYRAEGRRPVRGRNGRRGRLLGAAGDLQPGASLPRRRAAAPVALHAPRHHPGAGRPQHRRRLRARRACGDGRRSGCASVDPAGRPRDPRRRRLPARGRHRSPCRHGRPSRHLRHHPDPPGDRLRLYPPRPFDGRGRRRLQCRRLRREAVAGGGRALPRRGDLCLEQRHVPVPGRPPAGRAGAPRPGRAGGLPRGTGPGLQGSRLLPPGCRRLRQGAQHLHRLCGDGTHRPRRRRPLRDRLDRCRRLVGSVGRRDQGRRGQRRHRRRAAGGGRATAISAATTT